MRFTPVALVILLGGCDSAAEPRAALSQPPSSMTRATGVKRIRLSYGLRRHGQAIDQVTGAAEDAVPHRPRELARVRVLATGVIGRDQRHSIRQRRGLA